MAVKQMSAQDSKPTLQFIGLDAEKTTVDFNSIDVGSTYWATDTKKGYVYDGSDWSSLT